MISYEQAKVAFDAYRRKADTLTPKEESVAQTSWLTCVAFVKLADVVGFEAALEALKGGR